MKPVKTYLVCGSGMATSRMLEARLKSYFQSKLEILACLSYQQYLSLDEHKLLEADFLITTVPLPERASLRGSRFLLLPAKTRKPSPGC